MITSTAVLKSKSNSVIKDNNYNGKFQGNSIININDALEISLRERLDKTGLRIGQKYCNNRSSRDFQRYRLAYWRMFTDV